MVLSLRMRDYNCALCWAMKLFRLESGRRMCERVERAHHTPNTVERIRFYGYTMCGRRPFSRWHAAFSECQIANMCVLVCCFVLRIC